MERVRGRPGGSAAIPVAQAANIQSVTPVPFDLPVRAGEAAALAALIFEHVEGKPLTEGIRSRLGTRAATLGLEATTPWMRSLERDPIHPSTYYLAVDGVDGKPHLLHIALSTAPANAFYPKAILIGRMRPVAGKELVVNAVPFGPCDERHVTTFAEQINPAFLPKPQGQRTAIAARITDPARDLPAAFDAYRAVLRRTRANVACVGGPFHSLVWGAIRSGWRDGYSAVTTIPPRPPDRRYTRFAVEGPDFEESYDLIRQAKGAYRHGRAFDFEPCLGAAGPDEIRATLERLKSGGRAAQLIRLNLTPNSPTEEITAVARQFQVAISVDSDNPALLRIISGPVGCITGPEGIDETARLLLG